MYSLTAIKNGFQFDGRLCLPENKRRFCIDEKMQEKDDIVSAYYSTFHWSFATNSHALKSKSSDSTGNIVKFGKSWYGFCGKKDKERKLVEDVPGRQ